METTKRAETKKRLNGKTITLISAAVLSVVIIAGISLLFTKAETTATIYISRNSDQASVIDSLKVKNGASFARSVKLLSIVRGTDRKGAYTIEAGTTAFDAWKMLSSGAQTPIKFTFNNLRTLDDFADYAGEKLEMTSDEMKQEMANVRLLTALGFDEQTLPAMLLPDTYYVYWTVSPHNLLFKLSQAYKSYWNEARLNKAKKLSLSPVEVVTLASIVEEETAYAPEKGTVARLYLNRMKKGMKLQSDPTVKFAIGDKSLRRILQKHLYIESPYNTYMVYGLPPGPIRMPMKSTIDAVLNAPEHNYLYMCAKEDFSGSHNFAVGYPEHMANARRYQAELNRRGILQ